MGAPWYTPGPGTALFVRDAVWYVPNVQTGTAYTLVQSDRSNIVEFTSGSAVTVTVPADVFTAGAWIKISQAGAGQISFVAGPGLTLDYPGGTTPKTKGQWQEATIRYRNPDEAVLNLTG